MGGYQATCYHCRNIHAQLESEGAIPKGSIFKQCAKCPAVPLVKANHIVWEVFLRCWNQVLTTGMGEVVGLNLIAVSMACDLLNVPSESKQEVVDRVLILHTIFFPSKDGKKQHGKFGNPPSR